MKVNALDSFRNKLAILNDSSFMRQLSVLVQKIERMSDISPVLNECRKEGDIYIYNLAPYSLYFSILEGEWYFIDLINPTKLRAGVGNRNPIYNHCINPIYNHRISPIYNHSINPIYNHSINPIYNHSINPIYNHSINPVYNHSVHPAYNHSLHPAYNHTIHPAYNHSINPNYNKNIDGFYVYKQSNNHLEFFAILVPNLFNVMMIYSYLDCKVAYYAVRRETGFTIYNFSTNAYEGYLESNKGDGYNWFDINNKWIMFLV